MDSADGFAGSLFIDPVCVVHVSLSLSGVLSSAYREIHATRVINKYRTFLARPFVALQVVLYKNTPSEGEYIPLDPFRGRTFIIQCRQRDQK